MDWKAALTAFGVVFLAELGDKTQLTTITLAARTRSPWSVCLGATLALGLVTLLGALLGATVTRYISPIILGRLGGVLFVIIGVVMLLHSRE